MPALDHRLADLADGHGLAFVLVVAFALGLRHASDPDHLVAVSTLVAGMRERAARMAAILGAAWGAGHATTVLVVAAVPTRAAAVAALVVLVVGTALSMTVMSAAVGRLLGASRARRALGA